MMPQTLNWNKQKRMDGRYRHLFMLQVCNQVCTLGAGKWRGMLQDGHLEQSLGQMKHRDHKELDFHTG